VALSVQIVKAPRVGEAKRVERLVRRAFHEVDTDGAWTVRCCHLGLWSLFYVTVSLDGEVVRRFVRPTDDLEDHVRRTFRSLGATSRSASAHDLIDRRADADDLAVHHGPSLS
jgi:hypothetical protein